jgi:hypothetical protein
LRHGARVADAGEDPVGTLDYYSALARALTPSELARFTARRAYRLARRRLYRRPEDPSSIRAVLASHGVRSEAELAGAALDLPAGQAHCDRSQRDRVLAAVRRVPGAVDRALARAGEAARRRFRIFSLVVEHEPGEPIDWSRDPRSGHRFPPVPAGELALLKGGVDPKYPWALGRLDQLVALGQGAWIAPTSADRRHFERCFVQQLSEFIGANPVGLGIQWACPMEVALRAANIAQALRMLAGAEAVRDGGFLARALGSLAEHARYVEAHLEDQGAVPNNHLVSGLVGLLVVGALFPGLPDSPRHVALAAAGLREQIRAQVLEDGCSFEGSVPYHRLAVELFTLATVVARATGVQLGKDYADRLARMYRVVDGYCTEAGRAPQIGDNDSGRAFPLRDRESLDHGYLLPLGAALFCDARLKRPGEPFCDEGAWLLGRSGLARFEAMEAGAAPRPFLSRGAGWAVLRQERAFLAVSAGRPGQRGVGGHSHNDALSFELHLRGRPVIVDPGTFCYAGDVAARNAFRSTAAHSTLQLDGAEIFPIDPGRLFALPAPAHAQAEVHLFQPGPKVGLLSARHGGYRGLRPPAEVERTFELDGPAGTLSITDLVQGEGTYRAVARLHLPDRNARLRPATPGERARALRAAGAPGALGELALEIGEPGRPLAVVLFETGPRLELTDSAYSPGYGERWPSLALGMHWMLEAPGRMGLVVLWGGEPDDGEDGEPAPGEDQESGGEGGRGGSGLRGPPSGDGLRGGGVPGDGLRH